MAFSAATPRSAPNPQDTAHYYMGEGTHPVSMDLFRTNRHRLANALRAVDKLPKEAFVLLQGGRLQSSCFGDASDDRAVFRQESFFHWAFGVQEPDFYGVINVRTGGGSLFMPRVPPEAASVMGKLPTREDIQKKYRVENVRYTDELVTANALCPGAADPTLLLLTGTNPNSHRQVRTLQLDS